MLDDKLKRVAVLGAAGKMGSGIALLLLREMARLEGKNTGEIGKGHYLLQLIDANAGALDSLRTFLEKQLSRHAEKNLEEVKKLLAKSHPHASNGTAIQAFVEGTLRCARFGTEISDAAASSLIFEAIVEDIAIKTKVFSKIDKEAGGTPLYFTNTSSIPIGVLAEKSGLGDRLVGFHFYNPPAVQKLLEIIPSAKTSHELSKCSTELAQRLGKTVVFSNDVAGFIGNGHFIREIDLACRQVAKLQKTYTLPEAIFMVDRMTHEFLIRPMGIFQLLDYVGIDVGKKVMTIMDLFLGLGFDLSLIDSYVSKGLIGGQNPDGSQKDGIFRYEGHTPTHIHDGAVYVDLPEDPLGELPEGHMSWKKLNVEKNRNDILKGYFANLFAMQTLGAKMAQEHLYRSRDIARGLVADGVARSIEDVNTVMIKGFYHPYGPDNPWIPETIKDIKHLA